jgi:hypothetical protein
VTAPDKPFSDDELLAARVANAAEDAAKALIAIGTSIQRAWAASRAEEQASRQAAAAARDARIKAARAYLRQVDADASP